MNDEYKIGMLKYRLRKDDFTINQIEALRLEEKDISIINKVLYGKPSEYKKFKQEMLKELNVRY